MNPSTTTGPDSVAAADAADAATVDGRPFRHSPLAAFAIMRRLGWGVVDQGVSSLGNFALGLLAARALGAEGFGAFALAYVTYGVVLNAARGLATDPLLVRHSGERTPAWRAAVGAALATGAWVGVIAGFGLVVVGLVLPREVGLGFVALGFGLPGLMLQDACRFAFFSCGQAWKAVVNDGLWALLQVAALAALLLTDTATVFSCVLVFGGAATVSAGLGVWQVGLRPRWTKARGWVVTNIDLGARYLVENVSISGARQLRFTALGAITGLVAVGQVRAAEMLMGPFLVILMGMSQVAVPEAARILRTSPERLGRFCFTFGAAQAASAAVWGVLILVVVPDAAGDGLLGSLWGPAMALLPVVILGMCLGGFSVSAAAGVRALGAARRSLRAQLIQSSAYLVGGIGGAYLGGARGTCIGVAMATGFGAVAYWFQLGRARAEHRAFLVGASPEGGVQP
jgi:O-antigen/teichoic acid export membrane protein